MKARIILTLVIISVGIFVMYWLIPAFGALSVAVIGPLIFLFALTLWTLPANTFERNVPMDPMQRRLAGGSLGVGVGMLAGLAVAALVPRPYNWVVVGVVVMAIAVWYFRK